MTRNVTGRSFDIFLALKANRFLWHANIEPVVFLLFCVINWLYKENIPRIYVLL